MYVTTLLINYYIIYVVYVYCYYVYNAAVSMQ